MPTRQRAATSEYDATGKKEMLTPVTSAHLKNPPFVRSTVKLAFVCYAVASVVKSSPNDAIQPCLIPTMSEAKAENVIDHLDAGCSIWATSRLTKALRPLSPGCSK